MKPLTLEMSDPLTLGMGHPVTERIRRLSMRKTNLLTRAGTCAIILSAIGLTAPVFTATAASPVTEVVDSLAQKTVGSLESLAIAPEPKPTGDNISSKHAQLKRAPLAKIAARAGLKPMRLRMYRDYDQKSIKEVDVLRKAYVDGDKSALKKLNQIIANENRKSRFQLTISDQGAGYVEVSNGQGVWPGFPETTPIWEKRSLSKVMHQAMEKMIIRCSKKTSPKFFREYLNGGDVDIGNGRYLIECLNGSQKIRDSFSQIDIAKGYLTSEGLPLSERQNNFGHRMGFAMMEQYVKSSTEATYQDDKKACVKIYTHLKTYDFIAQNSQGIDNLESKCPTTNYNWVRRRHGVPEIKL